MKLYRQGDVYIAPLIKKPDITGCRRRSSLVLAEGEITGHSHRVAERDVASLWQSPDGTLYLDVTAESATVVHEEHGSIELPAGTYRVWRQREYTPEEIRTVLD